MKFRDLLPWKRSEEPQARPMKARGYAGAQLSRLVDFSTVLESAHRARLRDLAKLRAHSRDLSANNVYAKRFLELVSTHLVGPDGIAFESEIAGNLGKPKEALNDQVEAAWDEWGQACTTDGRLSWLEFQHLVAETAAVDGEVLIRKVRGYPNAFGFALELIDADRLDHRVNAPRTRTSNRVVMGVEMDDWGRRVAFHVWSSHPTDFEASPVLTRIPAEEILHVYAEDRVRATRGLPWSTACMVQMNMLGRLWTSELAAANHEADRLGIIRTQAGVDVDQLVDSDTVTNANEISSEGAQFLGLDPGLDVIFPQNQHPNGAFPEFSRFLLKGISAGLGVSYHSLAGDVSDANYSSARVALLDERDSWRKRQAWFIRNVCDPIFRDWLRLALLAGKVPQMPFEKACFPAWWPRSWDWVDPEKDAKASLLAIQGGLSTHQQDLGARGQDWREVFRQLAEEKALAEELGLVLTDPKPKPAAPPEPAAGTDAAQPAADAATKAAAEAQTRHQAELADARMGAMGQRLEDMAARLAAPVLPAPAPEVRVEVPPLTVNMPAPRSSSKRVEIVRDADGRLVGALVHEEV
ncbi:MAG: phage portal protein [Planctomycetia bacterium]